VFRNGPVYTKDTKYSLPGFSFFRRDTATGEPTGYVVEVPAMMRVNNAVEPFSLDVIARSFEEWPPRASAVGISSVFDAGMVMIPEVENPGRPGDTCRGRVRVFPCVFDQEVHS